MTIEQVIEGVSNADAGKHSIACLRIFKLSPDFFDHLRSECVELYRSQQPSEVGDPKHITHWVRPTGSVVQFSLLNGSGRYDDTSLDHNQSCRGKHFHHRDMYPMLARFLSAFPHSINFRLNVLGPKASLSAHKEHVCFRARNGSVGLRLRFHMPVVTNEAAEISLEDHVYRFPEGRVIFFNQGCVHGARNGGETDRLHLVWDMLLTRSTGELMFGDGPPPFPGIRYAPAEQRMSAMRFELPGQLVRLEPLVTPAEARKAELVEPQ